MKNEFQTWTIAVALAVLTACCDRTEQVNYLKDAPVVAMRVMIDGEEMIELDPSLLKDTVIFPLSYFSEELEIIKLDDRDEALTGAPYAYVSDHYVGEATGQWIQSKTDDDGNIQRRIAGDLPTYYIVDRQTLRGAYFGIENDFLDGERLEMPLGLNYGYYMICLEPSVLSERIEKALHSNHLTEQMRKRLTEVQAGLTENDNNYLLYAKLKSR